jgi:hypothetical protein
VNGAGMAIGDAFIELLIWPARLGAIRWNERWIFLYEPIEKDFLEF